MYRLYFLIILITTPSLSVSASSTSSILRLQDLADELEKNMNITVVLNDAVKNKKIRVHLDRVVNNYSNLLAELSVNNITAVRTPQSIKLLPLKNARSSALPVVAEGERYSDEEWVTATIETKKVCAYKVLPVIRPLIPREAHLAAVNYSGFIINDRHANIKKIKQIISEIESHTKGQQACRFVETVRIPAN